MKKNVAWNVRAIAVLLSMLLSACGSIQVEVERTPTPDFQATAAIQALQMQNLALEAQVATLATPPEPPLTAGMNPEQVRKRILYSFRHWTTVWAEGSTKDYAANDAVGQIGRIQVWISQPEAALRVLTGNGQGGVESAVISDGNAISRLNVITGQVMRSTLPGAARSAFNPPAASGETLIPHPLAEAAQNALVDLLLPSALAQRAGVLRPVSVATTAGRETLMAEWFLPDGKLSDRLWIDVETGVVLRRQQFSREDDAQPVAEITVEAIQYDQDLPSGLFSTNIVEPPRFAADFTGQPASAPVANSTADPSDVAFGEVYFWVQGSGSKTQLVRLPGSCLIKRGNCPEPDVLTGAPEPRSQVQPLIWSPDGKAALLVEGEQPGRLYRYTPADETWQVLAEADMIYAAAWSPDSRMIAFSARRGAANDIFILRPGGVAARQEETNLTNGSIAGRDDNLAHLAWLDPARLLTAASGAQGVRLFWVSVPVGQSKALMDLPVKGGLLPLPSPDGRFWALTEPQNNKIILLTGEPLSSARQAASFSQASIWPLVWSPDSAWVGFVVNTSGSLGNPQSTQADLYVIRPDGSSLTSLMRAPYIFGAAWSPDGSTLLASADDGQGYNHLFVVPLDGSGVMIIQSPGLYLNTSWLAPSWRP